MTRRVFWTIFFQAALSWQASPALAVCHLPGISRPLRCTSIPVFENRQEQQGRKIRIAVAVIPAQQRDRRPDPLLVLAGGPGQSARELAGLFHDLFAEVGRTRDILLVDVRGTGASNPLHCSGPAPGLDSIESADLTACLEALDADVRWYANETIADDLDEVLTVLGYDRVNVWGGSYGTRAALVFSRRHSQRVRSVILDSPAPFELRFPLHAAADSQRALDRLLEDCEADPDCGDTFPNLRAGLARLRRDLTRKPRIVDLPSPLTGRPLRLRIDAGFLASAIRGALYLTDGSSLLPLGITAASQNEFGPLAATTSRLLRSTVGSMAIGSTLSVLCTEDLPFVDTEEASGASRGTFLGDRMVREWRRMCASWPRGPTPDRSPRLLQMPALIVSGELDPVTPPRWGEEMLRSFANGRHVVVAGAAHNASLGGCLPELMARFVQSADAQSVDVECAQRRSRPPFVLDPTAVRSGGRP